MCGIKSRSGHAGGADLREVLVGADGEQLGGQPEGGDHVDPKFRENWAGARAAGIPRGAYHFVFWCRPAHEQAEWFKANVPNDPDALVPIATPGISIVARESRATPDADPYDRPLATIGDELDAMAYFDDVLIRSRRSARRRLPPTGRA